MILKCRCTGHGAPHNMCDVDPKTAMFHATAIGRSTHLIFKVCARMADDFHKKPDAKFLYDAVIFGCANALRCIEKVGEEMPKYAKCIMELYLSNWTRMAELDDYDKKLFVKAGLCFHDVIPNLEVIGHMAQYFKKIIG
ncbi:uncharacterized protein LOC135376029 [Ornithodoros turicata]|uniref:uncharacterized protein LOC135376029 n=1 Tax=Ornithodoros turicata TaxID=34597 RepID=UPI0031392053